MIRLPILGFGNFSGAMLNFRRVIDLSDWDDDPPSSQQCFEASFDVNWLRFGDLENIYSLSSIIFLDSLPTNKSLNHYPKCSMYGIFIYKNGSLGE